MKHLAIVRHGEYDEHYNGILLPYGIRQFETLGMDIHKLIDPCNAYILTSPARRARQGADTLAKRINCAGIEEIDFLWDAPDFSFAAAGKPDFICYHMNRDIKKVMEILEQRKGKAEALIIVSHKDLVADFFREVCHRYFGIQQKEYFDTGEGAYFNLLDKQARLLPLSRNE